MVQLGNIWFVSCVFSVVNRPSLDSKPAVKVVAGGTQWDGNFLQECKGKAALGVWANHPHRKLTFCNWKTDHKKKTLGNHHYCLEFMLLFEGVFLGSCTSTHLFLRLHVRMMMFHRLAAMGIPQGGHLGILPMIRWQPWKTQYLRGARAPQRPQGLSGMWRVVSWPN